MQHPCQVSFNSMQGCRKSWEDKLNQPKCIKIVIVKGHNSAKICQTWIISPHALLDLWYMYNICTKFHSNLCKDVGGVEKTNFNATEWREDRRTEWRTKQTLNVPVSIILNFYGCCGGIKIIQERFMPAKHREVYIFWLAKCLAANCFDLTEDNVNKG